jgi:tRNA pseudouridine55 synthase
MNVVVSLNKNAGITSHDAVTAVKKAFKVKKAGHTGTLDPIATGLMLICLNEATKAAWLIESLEKEYVATFRLGVSTDTFDSEGSIVGSADPSVITIDNIRERLPAFTGEIMQVPPMYSAIKVSGQPLYKLARKGIEIERKPRRVVVSSIELIEFSNPSLKLRIGCSKGTYIRSLCNDLGNALGIGAHVTGLHRTRIGNFRIADSATIDQLPQKTDSLFSIDTMLAYLPELVLGGDALKRARNGNPLAISVWHDQSVPAGITVRLKDQDGKLFGIGKVAGDFIKIERLLFL